MRGRYRTVVVGAAVLIGVVCGVVAATRGGFVDLSVYRFGGDAWLHGRPLYESGDPGSGLPFTYTPFAAVLFSALSGAPFAVAVGLWSLATVLAMAGTLGLYAEGWRHARAGLLVAALAVGAVGFEPMWSNLAFGQVNVFVMLALTWDLIRVDRRAAGVLLGVVAGVKLTPLIFIVLLVLVGRRRAALLAMSAFGATVAVGFALAPKDSWAYYTEVLWDPGRVGGVPYAGNQSVLAVLTRVAGHEVSTATWLAVAVPLSVGVLLTATWAWRRDERLWSISLTACAMLLASPISWNHHWVWAVPITLLVATLPARTAWPLGAAWILVFVSRALWWPPKRDDRELAWTLWQQLAGNSYAVVAVALAVVSLARLAGTSRASTDLLADAGEQGRA